MMESEAKRVFCPKCGWSNIRRSERAGFWDGTAFLLFLAPLRCRNCRLRFYRPWFLAKRAQPLVPEHRPIRVSVVAPDPDPTPAAAPAAPRRIILLLDDDPSLRKLLGRLLTREGYEVREASDSDSAVAALRGAGIDLVVINLSVSEAAEKAAHALTSVRPELSVIILTETPNFSGVSERLLILPKPSHVLAVVEGVRDLMLKPVGPAV
jgi:CheY-like chemotaxis protein